MEVERSLHEVQPSEGIKQYSPEEGSDSGGKAGDHGGHCEVMILSLHRHHGHPEVAVGHVEGCHCRATEEVEQEHKPPTRVNHPCGHCKPERQHDGEDEQGESDEWNAPEAVHADTHPLEDQHRSEKGERGESVNQRGGEMGLNPQVFHGKDSQPSRHKDKEQTEDDPIPEGRQTHHRDKGNALRGDGSPLLMLGVRNQAEVQQADSCSDHGDPEHE